eukprot:ANDGO_04051.mRNA.1 hypothetical protein
MFSASPSPTLIMQQHTHPLSPVEEICKLNRAERFVMLWLDSIFFSILPCMWGILHPVDQAKALLPAWDHDPHFTAVIEHEVVQGITRMFCGVCIILAFMLLVVTLWGGPTAQRRMMQFLSIGDVIHGAAWFYSMHAARAAVMNQDVICHFLFNTISASTRILYHARTSRQLRRLSQKEK